MKYRRWLISLTAVVALAFVVYLIRAKLERAVIAATIYHAHLFTAPPQLAGESRWDRLRDSAQFYWDFSEISIARKRRLELLDPTLQSLVKEINRHQAAGDDMQYSHATSITRSPLAVELYAGYCNHQGQNLRSSPAAFLQPAEQKLAGEQQASDGSWGLGIDTWYLRLYYSVDQAEECHPPPRYPLSFLDRVNSPEKLDAQLDSDLKGETTSLKQEYSTAYEELDETFSAMARLLFETPQTECYAFDPQLKEALRAFVERWQNPETGCWGQWLVDRRGRVWKMDDMAMTFHVISDLKGQVQHQDMIARRLLQLDNVNFPAGIRFDGHYENHLNWDAVKIFRSAWPTLDEASRQQIRVEISRMVNWCLTKSYLPDGSFKVSDLDDTPGATLTDTEFGFCRKPVISSAKTVFGPTRISPIPKLFNRKSKQS